MQALPYEGLGQQPGQGLPDQPQARLQPALARQRKRPPAQVQRAAEER